LPSISGILYDKGEVLIWYDELHTTLLIRLE